MQHITNRTIYALLFCFAITLHNIEEALWLPQWSQLGQPLVQPVTTTQFHFAVFVVTMLAYLIAFLFCRFPNVVSIHYLFFGFVGAMLLNTFFPHAVVTMYTGTYAPGLLTGFLLIVPLHTFILSKLRLLTRKQLLLSTLFVAAGLLTLLPILFQISRLLSTL